MTAARSLDRAESRRPAAADRRLRFDVEGRDWPNREGSRFVDAGGLRWHVQVTGQGPGLLLVHGTGASTHSFADLAPLLARSFTVVAPDLPGHAFTTRGRGGHASLPGMAAALADLVEAVGVKPAIAVGHSAGAAIVLRMLLDGRIRPKAVVSLNGALTGFRGVVGRTFSPLAKLLALNPLVPRLFAWRAEDAAVMERILRQTGSRLDPRAASWYARLARDPDHVAAALSMMANWDLSAFWADLRRVGAPVVLVAGGRDGMVPPDQAFEAAKRIPGAEVVVMRRHGHLAHEEDAAAVAEIVLDAARRHGALPEETR